jgi:hypothetical protein
MRIDRNLALIADKSLYDIWIRLSFGVASLEAIEARLGKILTINSTSEKVLANLKSMKLSSQELIVWKVKVDRDNKAYLEILHKFSPDPMKTLAEIKAETKSILEILNKLDPGASADDVELLANAKWIRLNTDLEPLIVSDDRDILTCCHIFSSFFGLTMGFLSGFEILRLMELDESFVEYCRYYSLDVDARRISDVWSKEKLEREFSNAMRKAKLTCHPNLRRNDSIMRIVRR